MPEIKTLSEFRQGLEIELQRFGVETDGLKAKILMAAVCSLALDYADGFYRDVAGLVARGKGSVK